jgi:formate dehydrogenase beta subunit
MNVGRGNLCYNSVALREINMAHSDLTSRDVASLANPAGLMENQYAPCRWACPVHADVRTYIQLVAEGRFAESVDVIRNRLAFACVCGRVCHHPCEKNCRRQDVDEAVAIRELKRFVAEKVGSSGCTVSRPETQNKARVAIVGSGPAGMSAALELARKGYRPTVFEKHHLAGGIPMTAIPKYRLPRDVLQMDVDWIVAHGVEVVTGAEIGKERTLPSLLKDGFAAVILATGLASSRMLPLPNINHPRVYPVLDFLRELAFDRQPAIGSDVLVVGGGNVAMDAARSAVRLGARRVRAVCLENEQEMPAWEWERTEALEEGVTFIHRRGPVEVVTDGGSIRALRTRGVKSVFDADKRFNPQYDDSDIQDLECDTVVFAIGQAPDFAFTHDSGLEMDSRGRLAFNPLTQQTSMPNIFACGEIVTPPGSVVEACASGVRVAAAVDMHLQTGSIRFNDALPEKIGTIPAVTAGKVLKFQRQAVDIAPANERVAGWSEVDHNLTEEAALGEARRCMGCGGGAEVMVDKCAACMTCVRVCPFGIPKVTDVARIDSALCQSCGICIAECPAGAIISRSLPVGDVRMRTRHAVELLPAGRKIVAYIGGFKASAADWVGQSESVEGVAKVYLASTTRLAVSDMLHALTLADGVVVVGCGQGLDRYPQSAGRTSLRVDHARRLLQSAGFNANAVQISLAAHEGLAGVNEAIRQAISQMSQP